MHILEKLLATEGEVTVKDGHLYFPDGSYSVIPSLATGDERATVHDLYGSDDIELDDVAVVAEADGGVWVSAWLWCPHYEEEKTT